MTWIRGEIGVVGENALPGYIRGELDKQALTAHQDVQRIEDLRRVDLVSPRDSSHTRGTSQDRQTTMSGSRCTGDTHVLVTCPPVESAQVLPRLAPPSWELSSSNTYQQRLAGDTATCHFPHRRGFFRSSPPGCGLKLRHLPAGPAVIPEGAGRSNRTTASSACEPTGPGGYRCSGCARSGGCFGVHPAADEPYRPGPAGLYDA